MPIEDAKTVKEAYARQAYEKVRSQIFASKNNNKELDLTDSNLFEDLLHEKAWDFEKFRQAKPQSDVLLPHSELDVIRKEKAAADEVRWLKSKTADEQGEIKRIEKSRDRKQWMANLKKRGLKSAESQ